MSELLEVARALVSRATGAEQLEAFLTHSRTFSVRVFEGEVDQLSSAEPRGVGVRIVDDHRVGFAYTTDLTQRGLDDVVERARANSRYPTRDEAVGLAPGWSEAPAQVDGLFDEGFSGVRADEKVAAAIELDRLTRAADPRIRTVEDAVYTDSISEVVIATSTGIEGAYTSSDAWCYSVAIATDGDDTEVGFDFGTGNSLNELDIAAIAGSSASKAVEVLGASKIPSAKMPVVFDPYTAGQFLGVIASVLTGEAVQKGRSLFAGRLGDTVASDRLTLWDDGRIPGAPGSSPWDAEGVPTGRTEVIRNGVLSSFLYDLTSARREGRASTGNATRAGFRSGPGPAPSNLAFDPTGVTREQLLHSAGRAFLVQDFHGVHSGANPISGDLSVGATGKLIDGGDVIQPVKEVTIAAPMLDILARIEAVADDRRWLPFGGSLGGATMLIAEMTVAGT
ncbi:MAG: TldD/PmbA family protein [Actinomycetota bacterium]